MSAKTKTAQPKTKKALSPQAAILSEISFLEHELKREKRATERAARKIESDFAREAAKLKRLRESYLRKAALTGVAGVRLEVSRERAHDRLAKAHAKRGDATRRRIGILEGRLNAL